MPQFVPLEDMERAHTAYNECTEELTIALNESKVNGRRSREQLEKIAAINKRCDELMRAYMAAFTKYYGEESKIY